MDKMIGQRIKNRRNELNITQTQIYKELGISSGNLSGIENGKSLPSATALIGLSQMLKCTTDYILFGDSPKSETILISNNKEYEDKILEMLSKLSDTDKEEIFMITKMKYDRKCQEKYATAKSSPSEESHIAGDIA